MGVVIKVEERPEGTFLRYDYKGKKDQKERNRFG